MDEEELMRKGAKLKREEFFRAAAGNHSLSEEIPLTLPVSEGKLQMDIQIVPDSIKFNDKGEVVWLRLTDGHREEFYCPMQRHQQTELGSMGQSFRERQHATLVEKGIVREHREWENVMLPWKPTQEDQGRTAG